MGSTKLFSLTDKFSIESYFPIVSRGVLLSPDDAEVCVDNTVFWHRYILSELINLGILVIPGQKIFNSDEKSFYPDYLGMYDTQVESLGIEYVSKKPLTVSVYVIDCEEDRKRVLQFSDTDLRWPTEIILIFDKENILHDVALSHVYRYVFQSSCWLLKNKGIIKHHDQIGLSNLMCQFLKISTPYVLIGQPRLDPYGNKTKNFYINRAIELVTEYITKDEPENISVFMKKAGINKLFGKLMIRLKKSRQKYQIMANRQKVYGR